DEPRLESTKLPVERFRQLVGVFAHTRVTRDSFRRSLEVRLHDDWERQIVERAALDSRRRNEARARRGHAVARQDALGQQLVERDAERIRIGAGVRNAELVEERWVEGFARLALVSLGRIEDEIRPECFEARDDARRRSRDLDALDLAPES